MKEKTPPISLVLLCASACIAIASLAGKATHHPLLSAWITGTVPMKDTTAYLFLMHISAGFAIARRSRDHFVMPVYLVALITFFLAFGLVSEISGLENFSSYDPKASFFPSIVTVVGMVLLAFKGVAAISCRASFWANGFGVLAALVGLSALCGYAFNLPELYYFIPGWTTAMAVNTGAAFFLLGIVPIPHAQLT